jgi:DnaJ-class molecular chaperone
MPDTKACPDCGGRGYRTVLVSQHDDEKETITCSKCGGSGEIHQMTDEEERDYHDNYW